MGQAKQRGNFEQRKAEAKLRDAKEKMAMSAIESIKPTRRQSQVNLLIAASMAIGLNANYITKD